MLDDDGQPVNRNFNRQRNLLKSIEHLLGLCRGLVADDVLSPEEIVFLEAWLSENEEVTHTWPGDIIAQRVADVLEDGVITHEEAEDLKETLNGIIGGWAKGSVSGVATRLPVEQTKEIEFEGRSFCFTGKFLYGPRKKCESAVITRGSSVRNNVVNDLNYLVIGALASRDWANTSHGRKIEKAVEKQKSGIPIIVIAEERWEQHL